MVSHIMSRIVDVALLQECGPQYYLLSCKTQYNTTIHMHACILTIMHTSPNKIPSRLSENASALTFETDLQMEWVGFTIRSTPLCNNIVYVAAMCTSASCGYMSDTRKLHISVH